ncbi:MAG TPA: hypothetical protein EYQ02_11775 [Microbacterium sp.]|nr:hypothetical protein [Microbacterium sp.]
MPTDPARHSLYLALGTAGVIPAAVVVVGVSAALKALGVAVPSVIGGVVGSVVVLALGGSFILVPVALAALGSYRRQTEPTTQRRTWTAVVLLMLSPLACALAVILWEWAVG